ASFVQPMAHQLKVARQNSGWLSDRFNPGNSFHDCCGYVFMSCLACNAEVRRKIRCSEEHPIYTIDRCNLFDPFEGASCLYLDKHTHFLIDTRNVVANGAVSIAAVSDRHPADTARWIARSSNCLLRFLGALYHLNK